MGDATELTVLVSGFSIKLSTVDEDFVDNEFYGSLVSGDGDSFEGSVWGIDSIRVGTVTAGYASYALDPDTEAMLIYLDPNSGKVYTVEEGIDMNKIMSDLYRQVFNGGNDSCCLADYEDTFKSEMEQGGFTNVTVLISTCDNLTMSAQMQGMDIDISYMVDNNDLVTSVTMMDNTILDTIENFCIQ
jgi:hypothetical protein